MVTKKSDQANQNQKIVAIKAAIDQGIVTKKQLAPASRGATICKILKGKASTAMVNRVFAMLEDLKKNALASQPANPVIPSALVFNIPEISLLERLEAIEARLSVLEQQFPAPTKTPETETVHGFGLYQRKTTGDALYWYAGKKIKGKQRWIYVGKKKTHASQKIRDWLEKNSL